MISCSNAGKKSTESKVDDEFESETDSTKTDLTNYTREWLEYNYVKKKYSKDLKFTYPTKMIQSGFKNWFLKTTSLIQLKVHSMI